MASIGRDDLSGNIEQQTQRGRDSFRTVSGANSLKGDSILDPESEVYGSNTESPYKSKNFDIQSKTLSYPSDLGSGYHQHYVKFEVFIVNAGDTFEENKNNIKKDAKPRFTVNNSKNGRTTHQVGERLGDSLSHVEKGKDYGPNNKINTHLEADLDFTTRYVQLEEMIGMPMPDGLIADHSMMWSRAESGMVGGAVSLADAVTTAEGRHKMDLLKHLGIGATSSISGLLEQAGFDGANTLLKAGTKRARNPRNEFLFDGVNNRSFNFSWRIIPSSEAEYRNVSAITDKFKLYMYPELDEALNGAFFIFPALFDITFMSGNSENKNLYKASTCALTNCTINYNGAGQFVAMEGTDAPFAIELTLQFTEVEFLHRKRFKDGIVR